MQEEGGRARFFLLDVSREEQVSRVLQEIANLVGFLASDEASFITGATTWRTAA